MSLPMPAENTFDHLRTLDGEQHQQVLIREVQRDRVLVAPTVAGAIAKSANMTATIEVPLPTARLFQGQDPPVDQ